MATRSNIAYKTIDGKIRSIYCHWDGYPEHNGKMLLDNYQDAAKIKSLIELGSLSSLREELGEQHPFDRDYKNPELPLTDNWCLAYHRDRGEDLMIQEYDNIPDWINDMEEYAYLWDGQNWLVNDHGAKDANGFPIFDFVETKMQPQVVKEIWGDQ
jgi:hypothetical protein